MRIANSTTYSTQDVRRLLAAIALGFGGELGEVHVGTGDAASFEDGALVVLLPDGLRELNYDRVFRIACAVRDAVRPDAEDSTVHVVLEDVPASLWSLHSGRSQRVLHRAGRAGWSNHARRRRAGPKRVRQIEDRIKELDRTTPSTVRDLALARQRKLLAFWRAFA